MLNVLIQTNFAVVIYHAINAAKIIHASIKLYSIAFEYYTKIKQWKRYHLKF